MRIHDISRPIRAGIPVWPGDTPFDFRMVAKIADGSPVNVGRVEMSVHTGSHIDAPLHFDDAGADAASVPLLKYVGRCVVADVRPSDRGILPEQPRAPARREVRPRAPRLGSARAEAPADAGSR